MKNRFCVITTLGLALGLLLPIAAIGATPEIHQPQENNANPVPFNVLIYNASTDYLIVTPNDQRPIAHWLWGGVAADPWKIVAKVYDNKQERLMGEIVFIRQGDCGDGRGGVQIRFASNDYGIPSSYISLQCFKTSWDKNASNANRVVFHNPDWIEVQPAS